MYVHPAAASLNSCSQGNVQLPPVERGMKAPGHQHVSDSTCDSAHSYTHGSDSKVLPTNLYAGLKHPKVFFKGIFP